MTDSRWTSRIRTGDHQASGTVRPWAAAKGRSAFHSGRSRRYSPKAVHVADPPTSGTTNPAPSSSAEAEARGGATSVDRYTQSRPTQRAATEAHFATR